MRIVNHIGGEYSQWYTEMVTEFKELVSRRRNPKGSSAGIARVEIGRHAFETDRETITFSIRFHGFFKKSLSAVQWGFSCPIIAHVISGNKNREKNDADHCHSSLSVRSARLNAVGIAVFKIITEPILQLTIATLNYRHFFFFYVKFVFCTNCKYARIF